MPIPVIHIFATDTAFRDPTLPSLNMQPQQDACNLSITAQSYFKKMDLIKDPRASRALTSGFDSFNNTSSSYIVVDSLAYADFYGLFIRAQAAGMTTTFYDVLDYCIYNHSATRTAADMDSHLIQYNSYTAGSIVLGGATSGIVYNAIGATYSIDIPTYVSFTFTFDDPDSVTDSTYEIRVWASSEAFESGYALSHIEAVVPPLEYNTILEASITSLSYNQFAIGSATLEHSVDIIAGLIKTTDSSGYVTYTAKVLDTAGNFIHIKFAVLYKGHMPDRAVIREAIRDAVMASNTGTESQWRDRIPELFLIGTMFIVPQWNNITTTATAILYRGSINVTSALNNSKVVLSQFGSTYIEDTAEHIDIAYNRMLGIVVPHAENDTTISMAQLHPTYIAFTPTSTEFQQMTTSTRAFAKSLNLAMAMASGDTLSDITAVESNNGTYLPIVDDNRVEWLIMTKESFLNLV